MHVHVSFSLPNSSYSLTFQSMMSENQENEGIIVNGKIMYRSQDTSLRGQYHAPKLTMFQGWDSVLLGWKMPWICAQQNLDLISSGCGGHLSLPLDCVGADVAQAWMIFFANIGPHHAPSPGLGSDHQRERH